MPSYFNNISATNYKRDTDMMSQLKWRAAEIEGANLERLGSSGTNPLIVTYGNKVNPLDVTNYSLNIIKSIMLKAGVSALTISSAYRPASEQARVMYNNLQGGNNISYKEAGKEIVKIYEKNKGHGADFVKSAMEEKIKSVGPENVSSHSENIKFINTIDIAPSSVFPSAKKKIFIESVNRELGNTIRKFLHPGNSKDPAFHIEIPQGIELAIKEASNSST